ncbi:sigma 54-interacting transcriptional regulator [Granulicella sp. S156]|uniref:sigma 54-interacting transcriptional regulator n=1 Tax=Granulicella sp. S156 TaxID=1747224 RepID=UPI00131B84B7|nr:sigma 54-interacting transcriptional regulator [Granulicella sp. S156]
MYGVFFFFAFLILRFSRERRRIESSLKQSRARLEAEVQARTTDLTSVNAQLARVNIEYKTIFDALPFAIALFRPGRVVRRCNPAYEALTGWKAEELIGKIAALPESEIRTWREQEEGLRAGRPFFDYEGPRLRRDGSEFPASISAIPLFEEERAYVGLVGWILDTTQSRLQQVERQMLTVLVQHTPGFIGVADMEGAAVFVNPFGQKLFGLEGDDHVKRTNVLEFFADSERVRGQDKIIPMIVSLGHLEFETIGRNFTTGETFPLQCTGFAIPDAKTGAPAFIATVAQDITERKRSEEELSRRDVYLTEGQSISHTGSWAWHAASKRGFWSSELFRILGYGPNTVPPTPFTFHEAVHPEDRDGAEVAWQQAVTGRTSIDHKHRIVHPDGSVRYVHSLGHPVESVTEGVEFIGTVMDVTEQQKDREALRKSLKDNESLLEENKVLQDKLRRENISLQELNRALQGELADIQKTRFEQIIGGSPALQRTLVRVDQVASTDATVLITGETGTGKELIAQAIHENSKRARMPFRSVNCAALPATLMAAELFGYEKGAFTGADRQRVGQFELAAGGTLFLDEIGELPIDTQAMLLRVLEERTFERLGGSKPISADVRVIAATNRDLQVAMRAGDFRPDLFYRLSAFPIEVPPLRERRDDIPMLVTHFIALSAARHGRTIRNIEKRGMELLRSYDWPGNIRELRNVIDTSVIVANGELLSIDEEQLFAARSSEEAPMGSLQKDMANHERILIERALVETQGKVYGPSGAGAILHLPPTTLSAKMKALGIDPSKFKERST